MGDLFADLGVPSAPADPLPGGEPPSVVRRMSEGGLSCKICLDSAWHRLCGKRVLVSFCVRLTVNKISIVRHQLLRYVAFNHSMLESAEGIECGRQGFV